VKYSNELKVGGTIILAAIVFILGVRYFEDLPLFRGTLGLETELANAAGLIPGNTVRVNGVTVGSVEEVFINPETNGVRVRFHVDSSLPVTEGSRTLVTGFDALGVVRLDIDLGPPGGARVQEGDFVPSRESADLLGDLSERAPELMNQIEGAITNLNGVLGESSAMLSDPTSDFRKTILSARRSMSGIDNLLRTERERIASVLENVDGATEKFDEFFGSNSDSLAMAISAMRSTMTRLDQTLSTLDGVTGGLTEVLAKVNGGQGTLGLLLNDPGMYHRTDSLLTSLQTLLVDFQENPGRYLKEMRLVDLF
jgi:phospholipid/cholesterol/gamma-HCH transport system substrate-binding protein